MPTPGGATNVARPGEEAPGRAMPRCMAPRGRHTDETATAVLWNDHGEVACGRHIDWLAARRPRRVAA